MLPIAIAFASASARRICAALSAGRYDAWPRQRLSAFSLIFLLIMLLALYQQIMAGWEARPPAPDRWGGLRRPA